MRIRQFIWLTLFLTGTTGLHAQTQTDLATQTAQAWAADVSTLQASSCTVNKLKTIPTFHTKDELYVAEFLPTGFLIFFQTDSMPDIIGYSTTAPLPQSADHPLFQEWLPLAQPGNNPSAFSPTLPLVNPTKILKGSKAMLDLTVEPLIEAKWGQDDPWNKFCPADKEGQHAQVGCVAVAMGQLMKKWNWPDKGIGSNRYTPSNFPEYGEQFADFDTLYSWTDMHPTDPADASAFLLYHAGVATFMNYGPNESGANTSVYAPMALKNHFKYYKGMQVREKERFQEPEWFNMIRQELINDRPVIYFGSNPDGGSGHAFNIDGFHSQHYFHFNWGWNGAGDGFFRLENMDQGGGNFTQGQAAIFWIQPDSLPMRDRPGFVQTLSGDGYVQLLWDELFINDLSHYNIYRDGVRIGTSITNAFRDEGLTNGTYYTYQISATYTGNNEGESPLTEELTARALAALPLPSYISFEQLPDSWDFSSDVQGFRWGNSADLGIPGNNGHFMAIRSDQSQEGIQVMDYLTAPSLDIRGIEHVAISFDYMFKQKPGVDYLFLMYRRFDNGLWYPIRKLNPTGDWGDWKTAYYYFPKEAKYLPIQLGFYYNDFRGVGYGAAIDNIRIWTINEPPLPQFDISADSICQNESVTFYDTSTGEITDWQWDFGEGAVPRYANSAGPHTIQYDTPGNQSVSLLLNHLDPISKPDILWVNPEPISGFSTDISGLYVEFTDTSQNADFFLWDFGNGKTSTEQHPYVKYNEFELYTVKQMVWNASCNPDTTIQYLDFRINSSTEYPSIESLVRIYPVPTKNQLHITLESHEYSNLQVDIYDLLGKKVLSKQWMAQPSQSLDVQRLKPGVFFMILQYRDQVIRKKIIIE